MLTSATIIEVADADIDRLGHANNSVYLRWIEQGVHGQWLANATPAECAAIEWIAVRHEIDYRRPALLGDRLSVEVRVESVRRARAWYRTVITRDTEVIAEALSCWCAIDPQTHRLTVIPDETAARFLGG